MVREHHLTPSNLIWPLFVCDGSGGEEPIISLPGVSRWSVDLAVRRAKDAVAAGIPCLALFPYTKPERRSGAGAEAPNPDNLMCRPVAANKVAGGGDIRSEGRLVGTRVAS